MRSMLDIMINELGEQRSVGRPVDLAEDHLTDDVDQGSSSAV